MKRDPIIAALVGRRISTYREAIGLSQQEVADRIGLTQAVISLYEHGKRDPHLQTAARLAAVFGVEISEIMTVDDLPRDVYLRAARGGRYLAE